MSKGKAAAALVAAVLAAAGLAAPSVVEHEGWLNKTYKDPIGVVSDCAGNTKGAKLGVTRTDAECQRRLADALVEHGLETAQCLPAELPVQTRAAFISFAYNVGSAKFCSSTLAKKARAGDLKGACAELSRWTLAGGKVLPGLVKRRKAERALCEEGLA
jgi:lysozyme